MKQIFILAFILISCIGCNDKKKIITNLKNMETEILNNQKTYSEKPYYIAKIQAQASYYEIFINDIPVFSFGTAGGITNEIPLNNYILKRGKQVLKIKLTPMFNKPQLSKQVDFDINIGFNNIIGEKGLGEYIQSLKFELPQKIKDSQLPFFEIELPFEANVPWDYSFMIENAQNLKENKNINQLVKECLTNLHITLKNKEVEKYNSFIINSVKKESDVLYRTTKEIEFIKKNSDLSYIKEVFPLPEYEIHFYADGKIISVSNKLKDEDGNRYVIKYKIKPIKENGNDGIGSEDYLYYLPKGKTKLEIF